MKYTKEDIDLIRDKYDGKVLDTVRAFVTMKKKSPNSWEGVCPSCGGKHFQVSEKPDGQIYKCWNCNEGGKSAIKFLMQLKSMAFEEALDEMVGLFCIPVKTKNLKQEERKNDRRNKEENKKSFCEIMLEESGLTFKDVTAKVYKTDNKASIFELKTFAPGTVDNKGCIVKGNDCIIRYFNLDGFPVTYEIKDHRKRLTGETKEYFRVRWQYPEEHKDKDGKGYKYKSPYGSGTPIYIPQRLRRLYQEHKLLDRIYIQEGEKKAEKACKHGIWSIAVSGIQNLGSNGQLPEDLVRIISDMKVREVVFLMDSDYNDLNKELKLTVPVDKRPRCFFYAARNYKEYMRSLKNRNIYVEIWLGHTKAVGGDKGIDDLLANTLKGNEGALKEDIEKACNAKDHDGKYVQLWKITSWTDHKLEEIWSIDSAQNFANAHKDILAQMPEFCIGRHQWKFDDEGNLCLAQPFDDDEKFWMEIEKTDRNGNTRTEVMYSYVNARNFLQNRGFGRYRLLDGTFSYIKLDKPFVKTIQPTDARDYILTFAENYCAKPVLEMLLKGGVQYLGPDKLSTLKFIEPAFMKPGRDSQFFYFRDRCWYVTEKNVKETGYENIKHHIWIEQKKEFNARIIEKPLITFRKESEGVYSYRLSELGKKCDFLQFLINTSNFTWRKERNKEITEISEEEKQENVINLLAKICAIGFLEMEAKDPNVAKWVVAMDGKQSEVGDSNGRSGKSLIGEFLRNTTNIAYINGKKRELMDDPFIFNDVTEKTKVIFFDDVLQNFDFEKCFPYITGDITVNYKGGKRMTIPFNMAPKGFIATNHAIRGEGSSFTDRQWLLAFSDFYNDKHKPADDFGCMFFSEWDFEQWNLVWNLVKDCIQIYLKFGVVQAPGDRLEDRKLRMEITEGFILWADEYYSAPDRFNTRINRKELYDSYCEADPQQRKYCSPKMFKLRIIKYARYKGYIFNPQMYDSVTGKPFKFDKDGKPMIDDKSGGIEYFELGNEDFKAVENAEKQGEVPF